MSDVTDDTIETMIEQQTPEELSKVLKGADSKLIKKVVENAKPEMLAKVINDGENTEVAKAIINSGE